MRAHTASKNRRVLQEKEVEEFKDSTDQIVSVLQGFLFFDRETKLQEMEQERSVRMASEVTMEGISAAELTSQYLLARSRCSRKERRGGGLGQPRAGHGCLLQRPR